MSSRSLDASRPAEPFQALLRQAEHRPHAAALRVQRRGLWHVHSWSQLARDAAQAEQGWAELGVLPGDTIVALGPLSATLIATLFAAQSLGATVAVATPQAEPALVGGARFVLAEGTHELERALRHRGPGLRQVVVSDAAALDGVPADVGVALHSFDSLLRLGLESTVRPLTRSASTRPSPRVRVLEDTTRARTLDEGEAPTTPRIGLDERVLADFEPTWLEGLAFVLHTWPRAAPTLVVIDAGGSAEAARRHVRAGVWLVPGERLQAFIDRLESRVPARGLGAAAVRAVFEKRPHPLRALARARLRTNAGLSQVRLVISDAAAAPEALQRLEALGLRPAQAVPVARAPITAAEGAPASAPARHDFAAALAATAS